MRETDTLASSARGRLAAAGGGLVRHARSFSRNGRFRPTGLVPVVAPPAPVVVVGRSDRLYDE
ncbi:hypothetical protein NDI76_16820 [Halogeometricum sp. S1BR25-6]|uniref:Alpha/beta hydrolase n=1 Tax=Halogeometricum salsisoli TaxID=2950536 RepID=A0ABU2GI01_9EURY|nr:hypothetical protein [Halogeometricum sp. S1BR25-6]MDS0300412.1 hypothetical protein [Halogeometricum sp. S1BR25-6]